MKSKEDAKAAGEKLREFLLELVVQYRNTIGKLDGSEMVEQNEKLIDQAIKESESVLEEQRKKGFGDNCYFKEGRAGRSFDSEISRLWERALNIYIKSSEKALGENIENLLGSPENDILRKRMRFGVEALVHKVIGGAFENNEDPAGHLLFHTHYLMLSCHEKIAIENVSKSGITPPELPTALFGIFCLLVEAEKNKTQRDVELAYSFLTDAVELIGMHEGASYVMRKFDDISVKRRARLNSERSRVKKRKEQVRACELFYSLRPHDEEGKPMQWASASAAFEEVWGTLVEEALEKGMNDPITAESTIKTFCRDLQKRDKDGSSLDIRMEVVQVLPDGTEVNVRLD